MGDEEYAGKRGGQEKENKKRLSRATHTYCQGGADWTLPWQSLCHAWKGVTKDARMSRMRRCSSTG